MILFNFKRKAYRTRRFYALLVGIVLLVMSGVGYRFLQAELLLVAETPIKLKVPLSNFPMQVGTWAGKDIPIPAAIQRVAGNDDFISRGYVNLETGQWVNLYVAFSARPRTMLGHRPQICYPASGWQHRSTEHIQITRTSGLIAPCLLHRFAMPAPRHDKTVVLNYYILNGVITDTESGFSGVSDRSPEIQGRLANYVAQVQLSSELENSLRDAAEEFTDFILEYFPDAEGIVKAAEYQ